MSDAVAPAFCGGRKAPRTPRSGADGAAAPGMRGARPGARSAAAAERSCGTVQGLTLLLRRGARRQAPLRARLVLKTTLLIERAGPLCRPRPATAGPRQAGATRRARAALTSTAPSAPPARVPQGSAALLAPHVGLLAARALRAAARGRCPRLEHHAPRPPGSAAAAAHARYAAVVCRSAGCACCGGIGVAAATQRHGG